QFHLADQVERADNCHPIPYDKSLLYLVSAAFEPKRDMPILGMQRYLDKTTLPLEVPSAQIKVWDWIAAPTDQPQGAAQQIGSTSFATAHGAFDDDPATRESILARINARREALAQGEA